jgi:hypothetical protein
MGYILAMPLLPQKTLDGELPQPIYLIWQQWALFHWESPLA